MTGGALFLLGLYFVPTIVAGARRRPNPAPLIIVNVFLGWTFIGWVVALAMAFSNPQPQTVIVQPAPRFDVYTGEPIGPGTQKTPATPEAQRGQGQIMGGGGGGGA